MRIVIDLQGAQSASRFRGIGRYALALTHALIRNAGEHEIWLVLNGGLPGLDSLIAAFAGTLPPSRVAVFDPPLPVAAIAPGNAARGEGAQLLREYFIDRLEPSVVLVTSLFEGYVDDAVTSVGCFIPGRRTAVVHYDLIPFLNPEGYLRNPNQQDYYARKIASLRRAGLLLAISDHARQEAIDALAIDAQAAISISTAVEACFYPGPAADAAQLRALGIDRSFVMYAPGGMDARKNIEGLIAAFAQLPEGLRQTHQLLIASKINDDERAALQRSAARHGLPRAALVLSGYVDDDLLIGLYRATALFVFPSLHEGFGLPALEAMACGAPVIGADNSSIPEVIGLAEALFDAADTATMSSAIARALSDPGLRERLRANAIKQASRFSWDTTARRCLAALEERFGVATAVPLAPAVADVPKRRLAFVSPLPPERSGIADYAVQLLAALVQWFDIELVLQQPDVELPPALAQLPRHSARWFLEHGGSFDQVLYQFGNSPYHSHMFGLLEAHPGVVVLHDFYLSRVLAYEQMTLAMPGAWTDALYHSHGYPGLVAGDPRADREAAHETFPCNLAVLQGATEVIVHSQHSKALAEEWYGAAATGNWHVLPLPRAAPLAIDRASARSTLGIADDVFLVCSFGYVAPTKLTHVLIDAWRRGAGRDGLLVLVGVNHGAAYGEQILAAMEASKAAGCAIRLTGWTDERTYHLYLRAADVAVQLRIASRGETSAAVLDCLNYGVPTIVNANGSMAELPHDAVCMLDEAVGTDALAQALARLRTDLPWRQQLAKRGSTLLAQRHRPAQCAQLYARVLDHDWQAAPTAMPALTAALATVAAGDAACTQQLARALAGQPDRLMPRQLLIDVTTIAHNDLRTGIERVVRAQTLALLRQPGYRLRVEPVRLCQHDGHWQYRYAHAYTQALLGIAPDGAPDHMIDVQAGDIFFGADYAPAAVAAAARQGLFAHWRARGIAVSFQVFDLLPVLQPQFFPSGAARVHADWLAAIGKDAHRLICISGAVARELEDWLRHAGIASAGQCIDALHLGADFDGDGFADPVPTPARRSTTPTFLMVGTIEPRKGHLQALDAFELLWQAGIDVDLVMIGAEGWTALPDSQRQTIPHIVKRLSGHAQLGRRLHWLRSLDDDGLRAQYRRADCLLAASEGEGFGLPLIEAAEHGIPILARDLPVFHEVAGAHARYFSGMSAQALADAVRAWLDDVDDARRHGSACMPRSTWDANARALVALLTVDEQKS